MPIKYFSIPDFEKGAGGKVKTLFTTDCDVAWKYGEDGALENYQTLGEELGILPADMAKSLQRHTAEIKIVGRENGGDGILRPLDENKPFDGLITNEKRLLLCTVEADCLPVYFYDPQKEVIAMVHSGWKGTAKKISQVALEKMSGVFGCRAENVLAGIGPHICGDCYEVGKELLDEFALSFEAEEIEKFFARKNDEKYLLNLEEAVRLTLAKAGVKEENIFSVGLCTLHSQVQGYSFCSYRRTKSANQRMLTAIMME